MSDRSRPPGARQVARCGALSLGDGRIIALGRLFTLHANGTVTAAQFEPLRRCLVAARIELDTLRFAAEDAVDGQPLMSAEAQRADVHARGAALYEALCAAQDELDILVAHLRQEVSRVS